MTELEDFLAELATDAERLGRFIQDPEEVMSEADLSEGDRAALRSGFANMVYARLSGLDLEEAFDAEMGTPQQQPQYQSQQQPQYQSQQQPQYQSQQQPQYQSQQQPETQLTLRPTQPFPQQFPNFPIFPQYPQQFPNFPIFPQYPQQFSSQQQPQHQSQQQPETQLTLLPTQPFPQQFPNFPPQFPTFPTYPQYQQQFR